MKRLVVALLLCAACHAHIEEEGRTHEKINLEAESDVATHVVDAPDKTTTTTEVLDEAGRVRKRRVQVKEHGTVTTDINAKSQAREDTELDEEHKSKFDFDFLHSPLTWIGAVVVLGLIAGAIWKFRKAIPL